MIQRIQTLYLAVVTLLMALSVFLPVATFTVGDAEYSLTGYAIKGASESEPTVWLGVLLTLAAILPLVTIFLFKRRTLQVRLCAVEGVLLVGSLVFIGLYYWRGSDMFDVAIDHQQFGWAAILPLISLVLVWLAGRAIFKDEVLVRSLDRIR